MSKGLAVEKSATHIKKDHYFRMKKLFTVWKEEVFLARWLLNMYLVWTTSLLVVCCDRISEEIFYHIPFICQILKGGRRESFLTKLRKFLLLSVIISASYHTPSPTHTELQMSSKNSADTQDCTAAPRIVSCHLHQESSSNFPSSGSFMADLK